MPVALPTVIASARSGNVRNPPMSRDIPRTVTTLSHCGFPLIKKGPPDPLKKLIPSHAPLRARLGFHRMPEGWRPTKAIPSPAASQVDQWPPGKLDDVIACLKRWAANAPDQNGKGRKKDWDKFCWNWLTREHDERFARTTESENLKQLINLPPQASIPKSLSDAQARIKPASSVAGTAELAACLTLVAPSGMSAEDRNAWLQVARATLSECRRISWLLGARKRASRAGSHRRLSRRSSRQLSRVGQCLVRDYGNIKVVQRHNRFRHFIDDKGLVFEGTSAGRLWIVGGFDGYDTDPQVLRDVLLEYGRAYWGEYPTARRRQLHPGEPQGTYRRGA
jgi:hypothetical protein